MAVTSVLGLSKGVQCSHRSVQDIDTIDTIMAQSAESLQVLVPDGKRERDRDQPHWLRGPARTYRVQVAGMPGKEAEKQAEDGGLGPDCCSRRRSMHC